MATIDYSNTSVLLESVNYLGRSACSTIQVESKEVSEQCALIISTPKGWLLLPFRGNTGLKVNNESIENSILLRDEDEITITDETFIFYDDETALRLPLPSELVLEQELPKRDKELWDILPILDSSSLESSERILQVLVNDLPAVQVAIWEHPKGLEPYRVCLAGTDNPSLDLADTTAIMNPLREGELFLRKLPTREEKISKDNTATNLHMVLSAPLLKKDKQALITAQRFIDPESTETIEGSTSKQAFSAKDILHFAEATAWIEGRWNDASPNLVKKNIDDTDPLGTSQKGDSE